jgi:hypothetical protein
VPSFKFQTKRKVRFFLNFQRQVGGGTLGHFSGIEVFFKTLEDIFSSITILQKKVRHELIGQLSKIIKTQKYFGY